MTNWMVETFVWVVRTLLLVGLLISAARLVYVYRDYLRYFQEHHPTKWRSHLSAVWAGQEDLGDPVLRERHDKAFLSLRFTVLFALAWLASFPLGYLATKFISEG